MELLESLKTSLEKQCIEQGKTLLPSSDRDYITNSLDWSGTIEGFVFWAILHNSYFYHDIYDYITIIKLYKRYGRYVFNSGAFVYVYYRDYFDKDTYTLTEEGFEKFCKEIEIYGAIRRD